MSNPHGTPANLKPPWKPRRSGNPQGWNKTDREFKQLLTDLEQTVDEFRSRVLNAKTDPQYKRLKVEFEQMDDESPLRPLYAMLIMGLDETLRPALRFKMLKYLDERFTGKAR